MVRQTKSIIEKNKIASALLEVERKNTVMSLYPNDKDLQIKCLNDGRKLNTKDVRIYEFDNGTKTKKYKLDRQISLQTDIQEVRMFIVKRRDAETLMSLICQHVAPKTEIHSDEWRAYNRIKSEGFDHYTVNHTENFVDPETKRHTQLIECLWNHAKRDIQIKSRGKSEKLLHGYLAQTWFFSITGKSMNVRFNQIYEILKIRNNDENIKLTMIQLAKMDEIRQNYASK